jgi:single-strand DNA-binding protein
MAGSLNKVMLIGRLGQDPKLAYLPSGSPAAEFTLATDESYKDRDGNKVERTEWHRIKVFGKSAEFCSNYLSKGRLVYVEGALRTRSWDDQQGQKRYMTEVVISGPGTTVTFLDSKFQSAEAPQGGYQNAPQGGYQNQGGPRQGGYQNQGGPGQGRQAPPPQQPRQEDEDLGPAFPSEASGMDDVPF